MDTHGIHGLNISVGILFYISTVSDKNAL